MAYFAGGLGPSGNAYDSIIDKLTYATDTMERLPSDLSRRRVYPGGVGNEDAGFFAGGFSYTGAVPGPTAATSDIDKLTYSDETISANPSNLSAATNVVGEAGNSTDGYYGGGNPGPRSTMDKITFSTGNVSAIPGAALSLARYVLAGVSPRSNGFPTTGYLADIQNLKGFSSPGFGYWAGAPGTSNVHKHYFATDSVGESTTNLNNTTYAAAGISNGNNFYLGGGNTPSKSIIEKITYATDTCVQLSATITQNAGTLFAYGNKDKGYFAGGANGGTLYSSVARFDYSSETSARVPGGDLVPNPLSVSAGAGTPSFGVFGGGTISGGTRVSWFQKLRYSSETNARIPSANLPTGTGNLTGTGTGYAGYRGGGETPGTVSTITRHVYSTDSVSNLPNSLPAGPTTNFESIGSGKAAYWGIISNNMSKMNYNTETGYTVPVPSTSVSYAAAASAEEFDMPQPRPETPTPTTLFPNAPNTGYWAGGESPRVSNVDKIEYASETVSRTPYGTPELRNGFDGTGDTEKAFYLGGFNPSGPGATSTVQKLVYATDLWSTGTTLLNERRYFAAVTGDLNKGYTSGGAVPATSSRTERITFSTEATALVPGANLSAARYSMGNVSNQTSGYALGGAPGPYSRVDKMTFSSETFAYTPGANLSVAKGLVASTGNASVALLIGGQTASKVSDADKLTFSTDTTSAVPSANLPTATGNSSGCMTGNGLNGYFAGGNDGSGTTTIYKVSFSTETTQYSPGKLSFARWNLGSSSALESNQVTGVAPIV